jgi:hypothetical protein
MILINIPEAQSMVQGEGFEPPNSERADLQSAVFDRFTNPAQSGMMLICIPVEPAEGFEPTTRCLQNSRSGH